MFANSMNPGCNCCGGTEPCSGSITFRLRVCPGDAETATVTVARPDGSPGTAGFSFGAYTVALDGGAGTYTVTVAKAGYHTMVFPATGTCGTTNNRGDVYLRPTSIAVRLTTLCGGFETATITLSGSVSGSCVLSDTTNTCVFPFPNTAGTGDPGPYTVVGELNRYVTKSRTFSWAAGTWTCSSTIALTEVEDCYKCCGAESRQFYPITKNVIITAPWGSVSGPGDGVAHLDTSVPGVQGHPVGAPGDFPCFGFTGCGCGDPVTTIDLPAFFRFFCVDEIGAPHLELFFIGCGNAHPEGSEDTRNGYGGAAHDFVIDSITPAGPFGGYAVGFRIPAPTNTNDPNTYFVGTYTVTEAPCEGGRAARALPEPEPAPPGLMAMAGNLARAVAGHVADGGRKAPPEVQAERKALCEACPLYDLAAGRCLKCGCVAMDLKRSWASSACPLPEPKWEAV